MNIVYLICIALAEAEMPTSWLQQLPIINIPSVQTSTGSSPSSMDLLILAVAVQYRIEHWGQAPVARYRCTDVEGGSSTKLHHYNDKEIGMEYGGPNADNRHWPTTDAA